MAPKFQIFVSSTFEDLRPERDQVIKAILEMGHIPVGMEMFSAADEEQWKLIMRQIDESDYYVVIVAHRYGSTLNGLSYTEREYDYALLKNVPAIGFIIDQNASWPADKLDTDPNRLESLQAFKQKLKQRLVGFWSNAEELHGKVAIALMKLFAANPRPGWVRATTAPGPEVLMELSRLSGENAKLRQDLEAARTRAIDDRAAEERRLAQTLSANKIKVSLWRKGAASWESGPEVTLARLLQLIAPELMVERSSKDLAEFVGAMLKPKDVVLRTGWPVPSNAVKGWLGDLMALGLVEPSSRKHSVNDTNEYWSLTADGHAFHKSLRRVMLEEHPQEAQRESASDVEQREAAN